MDYKRGIDRSESESICLEELVSADSYARVVDAFVDSLCLEDFGFEIDLKSQGSPPYDPADLLKLYLYGHRQGIRSSRKLSHACQTNIELWWLLNRLQPCFKTISEFRRKNQSAFKEVFRHFVKLLQGWDLAEGKTVAIDSVKQRAQNSRKNNYNQAKIDRHLAYIDKKTSSIVEHPFGTIKRLGA